MTITIGATTLCDDSARSSAGSPCGPDNLVGNMQPGVVEREYIGSEGVEPKQIGLNRSSCSFGVVRIFGTNALALAWIAGNLNTHGKLTGALKFGADTMMAKASVKSLGYAVVGSTVALTYAIEGY